MTLQFDVTQDREVNKPRETGVWYRPDGFAIPGLPVDGYHQKLYGAKGWSLYPPTEGASPVWIVDEPEPQAPVVVEAPPTHIHVFALLEAGAPCLVQGCLSERKVTKVSQSKKTTRGEN